MAKTTEFRSKFYKLGVDTTPILIVFLIFLAIDWISFKLWAVPRATEASRWYLLAVLFAIYTRIDEYTIATNTEDCNGAETD